MDGATSEQRMSARRRQTRSDCHSAMVPESSKAVHGRQGTALKRLAVTKRMRGGELLSFSTGQHCEEKSDEEVERRRGRHGR
jgi:hypothetical protein